MTSLINIAPVVSKCAAQTFLCLMLIAGAWQSAIADEPETDASHEPPGCRFCPDETGWHGWIEGAIGYQSEDDHRLGRFSGDLDKGGIGFINGQSRYTDEDGLVIDGVIEDLGRDSTHLQIQGGHQGRYKLEFDYREIPNYRENSSFSPFEDAGEGLLLLPSDWSAGATTSDMPTLPDALRQVPLYTERERGRVSASLNPGQRWRISAYVQSEEKQGVRDLGATIGFNQTVILPAPVDYVTDEIGLGISFRGESFQADINMLDSQFDNQSYAAQWRNPYEDDNSATAFGQTSSDSPDNDFRQVSALLGYQISPKTRVSARLSSGKLTQEEAFLPYTVNSSLTTTVLPTGDLAGEVNTSLASLQLVSRPFPSLRLDISYSDSERDNSTPIRIYSVVDSDTGISGDRKNRPYSLDQQLLKLAATYRLQSGTSLAGGFDTDRKDRDYTNVEETEDQTIWVKLTTRPLDALETTLKLSRSERDASPFKPLSSLDPLFDYPDPDFYNNELMRAFNMAERDRDSLGMMLAYTTTGMTALTLDVDYYRDDYQKMYLGLQQARGLTATASISRMLGEGTAVSAFYSFDRLDSEQEGAEVAAPGASPSLWLATEKNHTDSVGVSIDWPVIEDELDVGVDLSYSDFSAELNYSDATSLPRLSTSLSMAAIRGDYAVNEDVRIRFEVRHERYQQKDWTNDATVNLLPTLLSLGIANADTATTLGFLTLYVKF